MEIKENSFTRIGRWAYAICFVVYGIAHFTNASDFGAMVPVPGGVIWVYLTALCLLAAGISIITKKQIVLSTLLLAVMVGFFVLTVHGPAMFSSDALIKQNGTAHTFKDIGLIGAALFLHGAYRKVKND